MLVDPYHLSSVDLVNIVEEFRCRIENADRTRYMYFIEVMIMSNSRVRGTIAVGDEVYEFNVTEPEKPFKIRVRGWKFITIRNLYIKVLSFEKPDLLCIHIAEGLEVSADYLRNTTTKLALVTPLSLGILTYVVTRH